MLYRVLTPRHERGSNSQLKCWYALIAQLPYDNGQVGPLLLEPIMVEIAIF
jgi:hypothetical protein